VIEPSAVSNLLSRWWWSYDEGHFDFLEAHLTDDAHFVCRTDTGAADWEEFVRADEHGRDAFMAWQVEHRLDSPYPLRHSATNIHVIDQRDDEATFAHYIHVTHVIGGSPAALPGGMVSGTVRRVDGHLRVSELVVVLDTIESAMFKDQRELRTL
jgi:hypothetical protein